MDVRVLCLGMLTRRDATGYELKKMFEGPLRLFLDASFGSIYPALNRLAKEELVTCSAQAQAKRPDKKVYRITPKGRMAFLDALMHKPAADRFRSEFLATMLFADLLPPRHLSLLIDERIVECRRELAELEAALAHDGTPAEKFVQGLGRTIYNAALESLADNRHVVESEALVGASAPARKHVGQS